MVEPYALGADGYIVEPVKFENIVEVVSKIITHWLLLNELPSLHS